MWYVHCYHLILGETLTLDRIFIRDMWQTSSMAFQQTRRNKEKKLVNPWHPLSHPYSGWFPAQIKWQAPVFDQWHGMFADIPETCRYWYQQLSTVTFAVWAAVWLCSLSSAASLCCLVCTSWASAFLLLLFFWGHSKRSRSLSASVLRHAEEVDAIKDLLLSRPADENASPPTLNAVPISSAMGASMLLITAPSSNYHHHHV